MFKQSRQKIVASIMSVLVLLFLLTLAVIYGCSYFEVSENNYNMLERYAQSYELPEPDDEKRSRDFPAQEKELFPDSPENEKDFENTPTFRLSTFYSVAMSSDGQVLSVDTGDQQLYDEETLKNYAASIQKGQSHKGKTGSLVYLVKNKNGYTLIAFMDNTIMQQSMTTLFRYTLVFGCLTILILYFVAVYLARRIVDPLEKSYQAQKQFISDAGHELKTPVAVVNANAELLAREIGENQWLANIQYENERMGKLVIQLLELARTENMQQPLEQLNLSRLVAGDVLPFESIAYEKGLLLNTDIANDLTIWGNPSQLSQLVSILVDNAIRYSTEGKEVRIRLTDTRSHVILTVINPGVPIPQEQIAQLFERFYRTDESRSGEEKHYGLGLAIAKAITEAHMGKIEVRCYDGLVEFRVSLPKS